MAGHSARRRAELCEVADAAVANLGPADSGSSDGLTILFLLAQSIELSLKAFLQPRGYDQEKLRLKIGQDLPKALREAVGVGFSQPHPSDEKLLQLLDDTYRGRQYRVGGAPSLEQFRAAAQDVPDLRTLQE